MDVNMRLLMQYLSQAGGAMSQGKSVGPALNQVTQQQLGAQSQARIMKILSKMLRGEYPEGAKWSTDAKGDTLVFPRNLMTGGGEIEAGTGNVSEAVPVEGAENVAGATPEGTFKVPETQRRKIANPFAIGQLGSISADDLAGLSAQDVSAALKGALNVANLERQSINDVTNRAYKQALTQQAIAQTKALGMPKDERTAAIKNYEYAVEQGFDGSFEKFDSDARTSHQKDYEYAKEQGYEGNFHEWLKEMTSAGAPRVSITEKVETKKALSELAGQTYFGKGEFAEDLEDYMSSDEVQTKIFEAFPEDLPENIDELSKEERSKVINRLQGQAANRLKAETKVKWIENQIISRRGDIIAVRWAEDGKTMIWEVKWPTGDTTEVKYGIRD